MANIRVSAWAKSELRKRAVEEGRTVVAIVDRLLRARSQQEMPDEYLRPLTLAEHKTAAVKAMKDLTYEPET